jgi:hypothetical protein
VLTAERPGLFDIVSPFPLVSLPAAVASRRPLYFLAAYYAAKGARRPPARLSPAGTAHHGLMGRAVRPAEAKAVVRSRGELEKLFPCRAYYAAIALRIAPLRRGVRPPR